MKRYGFRIGDFGVEFPSQEDRAKAVAIFTKGCDVKINDAAGARYMPGKGTFSVYDRDDKEEIVNCCICRGQFLHESALHREYQYKNYSDKWEVAENHICDACFAQKEKSKKFADAKELLKKQEED